MNEHKEYDEIGLEYELYTESDLAKRYLNCVEEVSFEEWLDSNKYKFIGTDIRGLNVYEYCEE